MRKYFLKIKSSISGFTVIEVLIVVAFVGIMATAVIGMNINPSIQKGRDAKRKQDLSKLTRIFEDYYNDKSYYPPAAAGSLTEAQWGNSFSPYISTLPSDPLGSGHQYYYDTNTNQDYYVVYAKLENLSDQDIERVGCSSGCGPTLSYNYVVHSPNIIMIAGLPSMEYIGGGGGGGGGPTSTPTPLPTSTPTPLPPMPTNEPTSLNYNDLCASPSCECGTLPPHPPGVTCILNERCCIGADIFNPEYWYWTCASGACPI